MAEFNGFLFSKMHAIGSKSEGPTYYLQQFDYKVLKIEKHTARWEEDPPLQWHLGRKVVIDGEVEARQLLYNHVRLLSPSDEMQIQLKLESQELMLPIETSQEDGISFLLVLIVRYPLRSVWRGVCKTAQLYDFFVEREGKTIWSWSKGMSFHDYLTPVEIVGGHLYKFSEVWVVDPGQLDAEGDYMVRALFIPTGQEVEAHVTVRYS